MDSQMNNQWLSLAEYSGKYKVSVSTLRRRIRADQLVFSLKFGKYFLRDQNLASLKKLKTKKKQNSNKHELDFISDKKKTTSENEGADFVLHTKHYEDTSKKENTVFPGSEGIGTKTVDFKKSSSSDLLEEKALVNKLMDSQKEFFRQIEKKEIKINEQQNKVADLNTLVAILEKENKELKSLLYQEKEMEEWLELK